MPLFTNTVPYSPLISRPRVWHGNGWEKFKLGLTGSKTDGSSNGWGKTANWLLPVIGGVAAGYFTAGAATGLGVMAGNLANKGLNSLSGNMLEGTDTKITGDRTTAGEEKDDALVSSLGNLAGSAAGKIGAANGQGFSEESVLGKIFGASKSGGASDLLSGISNDSVQSYYNDEVSPFASASTLGGAPIGNNSSIVGTILDGISWLDSKREKGSESSLPYNQFGRQRLMAAGGEAIDPEWRDFISKHTGWNEKNSGFLQNISTKRPAEVPDTNSSESSSRAKTVAPNITENANQAFIYLVTSKKMNPVVAAGMIGNLMQESGMNPAMVHDNNTGYGLAGWRDPSPGKGRKTDLFNFLKANGKSQNDLFGQLDFLYNEAINRGDIQRAQTYNSPELASSALSAFYFRPNKQFANNLQRARNAATIYQNYLNSNMKKSFAFGGSANPFKFFEAGGEAIQQSAAFTESQVNAIREHYQLDEGETVNNVNIEIIARAGRQGLLPVSPSMFNSGNVSQLAGLMNRMAHVSAYSAGDAKVYQRAPVTSLIDRVPSLDPSFFAVKRVKGTILDPSLGTKVRFHDWGVAPVKSVSPFKFYAGGGESSAGMGKK